KRPRLRRSYPVHSLRPILLSAALFGCTAASDADQRAPAAVAPPFSVEEIARFDQPWAMTFLPGGDLALVTERRGTLRLWRRGGGGVEVGGVPAVDYGGQGGLGDVILDPGFATNSIVYLSFVEAGEGGTHHAAVGRGRLLNAAAPRIEGF